MNLTNLKSKLSQIILSSLKHSIAIFNRYQKRNRHLVTERKLLAFGKLSKIVWWILLSRCQFNMRWKISSTWCPSLLLNLKFLWSQSQMQESLKTSIYMSCQALSTFVKSGSFPTQVITRNCKMRHACSSKWISTILCMRRLTLPVSRGVSRQILWPSIAKPNCSSIIWFRRASRLIFLLINVIRRAICSLLLAKKYTMIVLSRRSIFGSWMKMWTRLM